MTTIINSPPQTSAGESMGTSFLIGIMILVGCALIFFYFGIPAIQGIKSATPQIHIPNKIDVNIQQAK